MKHEDYSFGVIFAGLPWNISHYQTLIHLQIIFKLSHLMPKGQIEGAGQYVGDGMMLLLHGGIFFIEVLGELLSVMSDVLQIH